MKRFYRLFLVVALPLLGAAYAQDKIRILAFEYPPYYQDLLNDKGLSCELVTAAFKEAGIDTEIDFLPVRRMLENANDGETVCAIGGKILFKELIARDTIVMTAPIQYVIQTFMYDKRRYPDGIGYNDLSEMKEYRIGVLDGSGIMQFLLQTPGLNLITNTIHEGLVKQLESGRVDAWAVTDLTGIFYMLRYFPEELRYYGFTNEYNLGDISVGFNKNANWRYYYDKFTDGMARIKANGVYMKIMEQYYSRFGPVNPRALADDMREKYALNEGR